MAIKWFASGLATLLLVGLGQPAGAQTDIKFTLDWKFQGPTAQFIVAQEKGYFEQEGLDVTIDSGNGSAGAVTRVASGAYQMGFADINALVEFMVANPGQPVKSVMMLYDAPPFGVYALKSSGIKEPKDLVGRTLGAPVFDASYKLFPAFAHQVGIDPAAVPRINMDPPLREAMLVRGDVDAITGHYFSSMLDLMAKGVAKDDIVAMLYSDYGMDFYGNGVIASGAFIDQHPDAVAGFNRAVAKGLKDVIADPAAAVALVARLRSADRPEARGRAPEHGDRAQHPDPTRQAGGLRRRRPGAHGPRDRPARRSAQSGEKARGRRHLDRRLSARPEAAPARHRVSCPADRWRS